VDCAPLQLTGDALQASTALWATVTYPAPNAFKLFCTDFVWQKHIPSTIETNHGSQRLSATDGAPSPGLEFGRRAVITKRPGGHHEVEQEAGGTQQQVRGSDKTWCTNLQRRWPALGLPGVRRSKGPGIQNLNLKSLVIVRMVAETKNRM